MKVVILAGGFGTRLSEETDIRPKPMVEIGGMPILWHIMKLYSHYGFHEFVILLGYKGYMIKDFFNTYFLRRSDFVIDLKDNSRTIIKDISEPWKIHLIDTGLDSLTGGRIKRAEKIINNEQFLLTYGDAVSDVNISKLVDFHNNSNKKITMTAVQPEGKFGALNIDENSSINVFNEKPRGDGTWVNGGFFVCEPDVLNYIQDDFTMFEREPLTNLAKEGAMNAFKHTNFWKCMDNLRDKNSLIDLWDSGKAPWKLWED